MESNFTQEPAKPSKPYNHMAMAIISTVLPLVTCTFFGVVPGIVSIVFASQVNGKYNNGDYEGSKKSAKYAKIAWIVAIAILVIQIVYFVVLIMTTGGDFFEEFQKQFESEMQRQQSLQN
jgi:uncharacterized protein YqhQ